MSPRTPVFTSFDHIVWYYQGACPGTSGVRHMCGCGHPEEPYTFIRDALVCISNGYGFDERPPFAGIHRGAQALLVELLDSMGLVEHGGSWFGSWLTKEGKAAQSVLSAMTDEEIGTAMESVDDLTGCTGRGCELCERFGATAAAGVSR